ncbi:helix-turn-helix domain-containing protein [Saccharibacillus sp. CPCC 101409]|uniref:helix-turn-helix domain-containing protein n=1 Tax=Saccharibacillus sp. CPCC 101409 TaxID=3058041 RepID=UPI002671C7F0|nr:helix-turn-helix domain-containing protein [Saccharibacillus sp. CPCC 101409]MDO3410523.1 helix-turn-helix domain-containing protein [Saccharibacillus sp. CPCC 101409]
MKRSVNRLLGMDFFEEGRLPLYVNRAAENFEMLEHTHDFIELTYVSEGSGVHYIGEESLNVSRGDVFVIPVGVSHVFRPAAPGRDRQLIVYNCIFKTEYLLRLENLFPDASALLRFFREPGRPWLRLRDPGGFLGWFQELHREYAARRPGCEAVLTALVVRMLIELHRQLTGDAADSAESAGPADMSPARPSIDSAVRHIRDRCADPLTLRELALRAGLSERQFSRLFVRQTGMNFSAFLQNTRVEAACDLLVSSHLSIPEVAAAVGYTDLKFFHRLFKRKTGTTPLGYRKAQARTSQAE